MCFPFLLAKSQRRGSRVSDIVHIHVRPGIAARDDRRAQFYRQLLDHVIAASSVVAAVADGPLNIPMLKTVATCAKKIAELGQVRDFRGDPADMLRSTSPATDTRESRRSMQTRMTVTSSWRRSRTI